MRTERVGFAICGSFCTHERVLRELERLCGAVLRLEDGKLMA